MRLIITNEVGTWAANYVKETYGRIKPDGARNFVLGLPTGGTAVDMYAKLVRMYKNNELSFKNISTFNMDEYVGLPKTHSESYYTYMQENLFKHVDIDPAKARVLDGNAPDLDAECAKYEADIAKAGGVDLFIGGVGENGHIAFNEPFSSFDSVTRQVKLAESTLIANCRFFDNDVKQVPTSALTVGIKTLLDARVVMIMITGEKKALALKQCIEGGISQEWPVSALQLHGNTIIVADEAACGELKLKTYKHFKGLG